MYVHQFNLITFLLFACTLTLSPAVLLQIVIITNQACDSSTVQSAFSSPYYMTFSPQCNLFLVIKKIKEVMSVREQKPCMLFDVIR